MKKSSNSALESVENLKKQIFINFSNNNKNMPEREFSEEDKKGFREAFTIFDKGLKPTTKKSY